MKSRRVFLSSRKGSGILFVISFGLLLALVGSYAIYDTYRFYKTAVLVKAVIVDVKTVSTGKGFSGQLITVKYLVDGKEYSCSPKKPHGHTYRKVGDTITAGYSPLRPERCRTDNDEAKYWFDAFIVFLGIFFVLAGSFGLRKIWFKKKQ